VKVGQARGVAGSSRGGELGTKGHVIYSKTFNENFWDLLFVVSCACVIGINKTSNPQLLTYEFI